MTRLIQKTNSISRLNIFQIFVAALVVLVFCRRRFTVPVDARTVQRNCKRAYFKMFVALKMFGKIYAINDFEELASTYVDASSSA